MSRSLSPCPAEGQVERLLAKADHIILTLRAVRRTVACPGCARPSRRIHSSYERRLADLPWNGVPVRIQLSTRRFFCDSPRRIFTERLPGTTETYARRTLRMEQALRWLGLALASNRVFQHQRDITAATSLAEQSKAQKNEIRWTSGQSDFS
jgi:transposase